MTILVKKHIPTLMLTTCLTLLAATATANAMEPQLRQTTVQTQESSLDANTRLIQVTYAGSDSLAIGDPLGNHPMTPRDDAGPPSTRRLSYDNNCRDEACIRAEQRWMSPTHWTQDRASGRSQGWGDR